MPYQRLNPRFQVSRIKRLGYIVIRTILQPSDTIVNRRFGRKQDHGNMTGIAIDFYCCQQFNAIHFGHHHITDNQIRQFPTYYFQTLPAVTGFQYMITVSQYHSQKTTELVIVFYDQNTPLLLLLTG